MKAKQHFHKLINFMLISIILILIITVFFFFDIFFVILTVTKLKLGIDFIS